MNSLRSNILSLLSVLTIFSSNAIVVGVNGRDIRTGNVQLDPPKISEVVDLYLSANIATTIPQLGHIEYIFPSGSSVPFETQDGCKLEVPPELVRVSCTYSFTTEENDPDTTPGLVKLTANNFDVDIEEDSYFSLRVAGFMSPRSTADTSSFRFTSFDAEGTALDRQIFGLVAQATEYHEIKTVSFESTSQVIGQPRAFLQVTFVTLDELLDTDWIQITIPKWNLESSFPAPMITYNRDELTCSGVSANAKVEFDCFLKRESGSDMLSLRAPLIADPDTGVIARDSEISVLVGPITNPLSAAMATGFQIRTLSSNLGNIANGSGQLTVSEAATVSNQGDTVSVAASETLINQQTTFLLSLELPLPLNRGCQIDLYIPKPLFIGAELVDIVIGGLFGSLRQATYSLDATQNHIHIEQACLSYRQNAIPATIELTSFVNPGYVITTDSFYIKILDKDGNKIVQTTGGMVHTTTPGTMQVKEWYAQNRLVSALSELTFAVQPLDPTASANAQIKLKLPIEDFEVLPDPCEISYHNQLVNDKTWTCQTDADTNTFILQQLLEERYVYDAQTWIELSIDKIKMPTSSRPTGDYEIEFYDNIDGVYRLVDIVTVSDKFQALPGGLYSVNVEPLLATTYTKDTMTLQFTLSHQILQGGYLTVNLPAELTFVDTPQCLSLSSGIDQDAICTFDMGSGQLTLRDGFKNGPYDQLETPLDITVSNIFTPRTVTPTSNFAFQTFDSEGYGIDTHSGFFLPGLNNAQEITQMRLIQSETEVGKSTIYDILVKSPYPLYSGDLLTLTAPGQAGKNLAQTFRECTGSPEQAYLKDQLHSILIGLDGIKVTLDFKDGITEVPIGAELGFKLKFLENPRSTRPTEPFHVIIKDFRESLIVEITEEPALLESFVMQATTPAELIYGMINNDPKQALEPTLIQMQLITKHALPMHSELRIDVPSTLGLPEDDAAGAEELRCFIDSSPFDTVECTFDRDTFTFRLIDVNPHGMLRGGATLQVELNGLYNRKTAEVSDSFTALTLTQDGFLIDELVTGMTVASNCDWPCWECPIDQPSKCLKCDTRPDSLLPLLFNGTCRNDCPSNYYEINGICSQCDAGCLECDQTSQECYECHFGMYLLGNTCMDKCPNTHHGIDSTKSCDLCESPCVTCEGSLTTCSSCDQTLPWSYFFRNECFAQCPLDISVEDEGVCVECNDNCKTCDSQYSSEFCTSCYGDFFLDYSTNMCVELCPAGVSVAQELTMTPKGEIRTCNLCDPSCLTCDPFNTQICLECRDGLKMLETAKTCILTCPVGTAEIWLPLTQDTICTECAPGCTECEYSRDHCTICKENFVFHDFSCVPACPSGFKKIDSDGVPTCALEREPCQFGQQYNDLGVCELYLAECKVGYVLNSSQTECIPEPGFHLPFAFLYGAAGWCFFILRKKNRDKFDRDNLVSQLLLGFTALQQLNYIFQLILAYTFNFTIVSGMHTFAMFAHYFLNAVCLIAIHYLIKDKPFEHWRDQYTRENQIIATVSTVYSFKATRLLYANLLEKPYFEAACESRFRSLIRPMFMVTMASLIPTGTILMANVYTIWLLRWGHEIVTLAISSIILALVIFALEVYEFVLHKRAEPNYLGVGKYFMGQGAQTKKANYGSGKSNRKSQVRVMNVMDDGPEAGVPMSDEDSQQMSQSQMAGAGMNNNMSQKILLGSKSRQQALSDQKTSANIISEKGGKRDQFQFENIQMGKAAKIDADRIDFGEQGQAICLQQMIKKLDEHQQLKKFQKNLDTIHAQDQAAYDGKEIPHSSGDEDNFETNEYNYEVNNVLETGVAAPPPIASSSKQQKQHAVVDQYLDESIRKKLLVSSTKDKTKQFRQKRQQFEKHRKLDQQSQSFNAGDGAGDRDRAYYSDFEDKHKVDMTSINPMKRREKPLRQMITTVQLGKEGRQLGYIEKFQECSDGELERDKLLYDQFYVKFKKQFDDKARKGELVPNAKLHQSFDEDVLREMYDDFGVESDFDSELSWISYPPDKGFLRDYYENNPVKQAENELFKQKIKIKFQYDNLYRESYSVPPKQKLNLKPSVKTQTMASDMRPPEAKEQNDDLLDSPEQKQKGKNVIQIDFDPFESEEEFVIEESEQLSAIDEAIYEGIVDKVIYEGFSDLDSDQYMETHQNMLSQEGAEISSKAPSRLRGKKGSKDLGATKKRKRGNSKSDFAQIQGLAKKESQINRVGLFGRATDSKATKAMAEHGGKLGDVYDTRGHLVYDKEYISQMDDAGIDSLEEGSQQQTDRRSRSGSQTSIQRQQAQHRSTGHPGSQASRIEENRSKSDKRKSSLGQAGAVSSFRPSLAPSYIEKDLSSMADEQQPGISQNNFFDVQDGGDVRPEQQTATQQYPPGQNLSVFNNNHANIQQQQERLQLYDDFYDSETDKKDKSGLSKRERQMIKAYSPDNNANGPPEEPVSAHNQRRKSGGSSTGVSRKRKRQQQPMSPQARERQQQLMQQQPLSNRGITDAQEQIEQETKMPDNGILRLVINNQQLPEQEITMQEAVGAKKGEQTNSEMDAIIDQETRGGNLSSSAHEQSSNQNLHGYNTASMGKPITVGTFTQGPSSAIKAHQLLNNQTQWESDASNSQLYALQGRKLGAHIPDSPQQDGAMRTDDEMIRRGNLNQTEIGGVNGATYGVEIVAVSEELQQVGNWSDDGAQQQRQQYYEQQDFLHSGVVEDHPFGKLGQSYPLNRKMTGPQPFQSLGVATKPFKARRKRKNEQLLADQRRAKFSMGSDRMVKLENIYIKHGLAQTAMRTVNNAAQLPPRGSSIPRADSLANETIAAFRRHGKHSDMYKQGGAHTTSKVNRRTDQGLRLHKQNFVEDGQNIISGQLYKQPSARGFKDTSLQLSVDKGKMPHVKRELYSQNQHLSNSASENTDLHILKQLGDSRQISRQELNQSSQHDDMAQPSPIKYQKPKQPGGLNSSQDNQEAYY